MNYRGDTFWRTYKVKYDNAPYTFASGDKITVAFIRNGIKYLKKEIDITDGSESVTIEWDADEMKTLKYNCEYILEAEISTNDFVKTYQETIEIKRDYIV